MRFGAADIEVGALDIAIERNKLNFQDQGTVTRDILGQRNGEALRLRRIHGLKWGEQTEPANSWSFPVSPMGCPPTR